MSFGVFQFRRGTAAEWTSANTILASGELGIETDTSKIKIGDGTTAWNSLGYAGIPGPTGPTGPSGNAMKSVTLDFGSSPVYSKTFSITDASVVSSSNIALVPDPNSDEYEMDGFLCSAYCAVDGTVTAYITAIPGPVTGTRNFNYFLG